MTPRLSIVIVTYNSRADVLRCLASLMEHPSSVTREIVVVDNASEDGTSDAVRARWQDIAVIDAGVNAGFATANNIGIGRSSGDLVLLLNPDTVVPPGAIDGLVGALDAHPRAAVIGPRIVDGEGVPEVSFGSMIAPWAELRQKVLVAGNTRGVRPIRWWVDRMTRGPRRVDWVSGACLLIRRADLDAAGGLDERFFMYAEDVDLCAAVRRRGRQVMFWPRVEIVHLRGRSAASAPRETEAAYRRSQMAFYEKHHPHWVPLLRLYLRLTGSSG